MTDVADNKSITDRCIERRKKLDLIFCGAIQLAKNFANFIKNCEKKYERVFRNQQLNTRACASFDYFFWCNI